uniref:Uncharacterized protein n=1 Tax=Davidia involucrata TaxID=16924 RepID=A0A5B7BLL7_DAVIN
MPKAVSSFVKSCMWGGFQIKDSTKCCNKATEFICSACMLCVSCPLTIVWCCIKLPCKIGWRMAQHAKHRACCASQKKICAAYSSFSDIGFDIQPSEGVLP